MRSARSSPDRGSRELRPPARHRRSQVGLVVAGAVIVVAGFAVALVEAYRLPKGSIWVVVGLAAGLVAAIRALTRSR